jgi:hypothetical protein
MTEYVVRFLVGGVLVSAFAMLGDILRPKSFAGLFGAAPSVALATLGIAVYRHGADYAAQQSWAMTAGAIALAVYSVFVCHFSFVRGCEPLQLRCCRSSSGLSSPSAC